MTEERIGFYCNIASKIKDTSNNEYYRILKSHYLMKCKEVTGGYGLPVKHFSRQIRCSRCCLEFEKGINVSIKPNKSIKKQRKKSKSGSNINNVNIMEIVCPFCKQVNKTRLTKPTRDKTRTVTTHKQIPKANVQKKDILKQKKEEVTKKMDNPKTTNVYTNAHDVFSLKNKNNTLQNTIKVAPKVIKNNKKRKDKFAGLCQKAVLASAKLKEEKKNGNDRLSLFLKPSSG